MAFRSSPVLGQPGYAWLDIDAAVRQDVTFRLSCPNRQLETYLGPRGWQGPPYEWKPLAVEPGANGVRLQVGPDIVDKLHPDVQVRIEIPSANYDQTTWWDDIPPSRVQVDGQEDEQPRQDAHTYQPQTDKIRGAAGGEAIKSPVEDRIKPEPVKPEPIKTEPVKTEPVKTEPVKTEPVKNGRTGSDDETVTDTPSKRRWLMAVAATLAGLIIGAFLGYSFINVERVAAPTGTTVASSVSTSEAIRLLSSRERQPERLYQVGTELRGIPGESRDVALQAIRRAAESGYAPALLWLAQSADPARQDWKGVTAQPDAVRALDGYVRAEQAGNLDAVGMHSTLCGYLRATSQITVAERQAMIDRCR